MVVVVVCIVGVLHVFLGATIVVVVLVVGAS